MGNKESCKQRRIPPHDEASIHRLALDTMEAQASYGGPISPLLYIHRQASGYPTHLGKT